MYKLPYTVIRNQLLSIDGIDKVEWYTQQDQTAGGLLKDTCVFIEFSPTRMRDIGRNVQEGELEWKVILITNSYADGDKRILKLNNPTDDHLDLSDKIYKTLADITMVMLSEIPEFAMLADTENDIIVMKTISRTDVTPFHTNDKNIRSYQQFTTYFKDCTASKSYQKVTRDLTINEIK